MAFYFEWIQTVSVGKEQAAYNEKDVDGAARRQPSLGAGYVSRAS